MFFATFPHTYPIQLILEFPPLSAYVGHTAIMIMKIGEESHGKSYQTLLFFVKKMTLKLE